MIALCSPQQCCHLDATVRDSYGYALTDAKGVTGCKSIAKTFCAPENCG